MSRIDKIRERWANVPEMGVGIWEHGDSLYEQAEPHRTVGHLHEQISRDVAIALSKSKSDIDYLLSQLNYPHVFKSMHGSDQCWHCDKPQTLHDSTAPTETSARCGECGHADEIDPRGQCMSIYYDAGGSLCYCGCKCNLQRR